jgi:3-dehydroquinate synthase
MSYFRGVIITTSTLHFGEAGIQALDALLLRKKPSKVFILVDGNTSQCLPFLAQSLAHLPEDFEILEVDPGEESKELEVAANLWHVLLDYGADRNTLLINLGGGVVCDLGAFIASTFKRGISFVHVPTSLLAMVDASVGGKNGLNFAGLKNQIGTFNNPDLVLIEPKFLETLPELEWESGHGEMIKHSLISGRNWPLILSLRPSQIKLENISESVAVKENLVSKDFKEAGLRKVLNLGHTFGHALESLRLAQGNNITHGAAVIQGLHLALELSGLADEQQLLAATYSWSPINDAEAELLWELQRADKKNEDGMVKFVLLSSVGHPTYGNTITKDRWCTSLATLNGRKDG